MTKYSPEETPCPGGQRKLELIEQPNLKYVDKHKELSAVFSRP